MGIVNWETSLWSFDTEEMSLISFSGFRYIVIGDDEFVEAMREINNDEFYVYLTPNDSASASSLVNLSLRMRPDCLVLSEECYGAAAYDAKRALETGHYVMVVTRI